MDPVRAIPRPTSAAEVAGALAKCQLREVSTPSNATMSWPARSAGLDGVPRAQIVGTGDEDAPNMPHLFRAQAAAVGFADADDDVDTNFREMHGSVEKG